MTTIKVNVKKICQNVKNAHEEVGLIASEVKNKILLDAADLIEKNIDNIIAENKKDVEFARSKKIEESKIDRLILNQDRVKALSSALREIEKLDDPVNKTLYHTKRENGLEIKRVTTPIGTMLAIFEARPNVAIDISALALKSGNSAILRSGSESLNSARILVDIFRQSLRKNKINENIITLIDSTNRDYVKFLLKMEDYIDVVVPRGGKSLITAVSKGTKIPIFKHLDGNCHSYIHEKADIEKARKIVLNAKLRRTSICGATESLVIDKKIAQEILPKIVHDLFTNGCEIRGDKEAQKIDKIIKPASSKDYKTEYLDKIISVKIVKNIDEAINHINNSSSGHTEAIITEDKNSAQKFLTKINSAIAMHNASTQFADGGEFGLGAEVGISTGKLHARGPVGLEQLVTYKYQVESDFAVRS